MKTKIWTAIVATMLFLLTTTNLSAQTKYEFATLRCFPGATVGLKEYAGITLTTKNGIQVINSKPENPYVEAEKKLNELSAEGWEVYEVTSVIVQSHWSSYYLRRKVE